MPMLHQVHSAAAIRRVHAGGRAIDPELAAEAWLKVAAGIVVDEHLLTSDPDISAIGDCALYTSKRFGGSLRLESVQNAVDQARALAARLAGKPAFAVLNLCPPVGDDPDQAEQALASIDGGGPAVNVVISLGPAKPTVPVVTGLPLDAALTRLEGNRSIWLPASRCGPGPWCRP